jgi:hypothetical protein
MAVVVYTRRRNVAGCGCVHKMKKYNNWRWLCTQDGEVYLVGYLHKKEKRNRRWLCTKMEKCNWRWLCSQDGEMYLVGCLHKTENCNLLWFCTQDGEV